MDSAQQQIPPIIKGLNFKMINDKKVGMIYNNNNSKLVLCIMPPKGIFWAKPFF